ncbi:hypothetical protein ABTZ59_34345 [Streptomyces sp. NPDC094034]|uniref:hypothetical protein n=1 Tax=Streptomyces sp. NPDC094034 TaxID=3155309 RepID=UPI003324B7B5
MNGTAGHGKGGRGSRPCAVLLIVLAALFHVLACAHGPVSAAAPPGAAAVPPGAAMSTALSPRYPAIGHPPTPVAGCAGRAGHGAASCTDTDEPSVLPQRPDAFAVPLAADGGPDAADRAVRNPMGPGAHAAREDAGGERDTRQRRRAALGVWRN